MISGPRRACGAYSEMYSAVAKAMGAAIEHRDERDEDGEGQHGRDAVLVGADEPRTGW